MLVVAAEDRSCIERQGEKGREERDGERVGVRRVWVESLKGRRSGTDLCRRRAEEESSGWIGGEDEVGEVVRVSAGKNEEDGSAVGLTEVRV